MIHERVRNGKAGATRAALDPDLRAVGELSGDEPGEEVAAAA